MEAQQTPHLLLGLLQRAMCIKRKQPFKSHISVKDFPGCLVFMRFLAILKILV